MKRILGLILVGALAGKTSAQVTARQPLFTLPTSKTATETATGTPIYTSALGGALEGETYPVTPRFIELEIQNQRVRMFYMDAATGTVGGMAPTSPRPMELPAVLLLHGKNFSGFYFENVMRALVAQGYRVLVPDQIGFGKSSKPDINYSFDLLADNTAKLLDALKIERVSVLGHSMGGMLAARFALKYPNRVNKLILENPIGLEDYSQFIPAQSLESVYARELADTDASKTRAFYGNYFVTWKPEYERFVAIKARQALGGEWPRVAKSSALTYQMIINEPVVGEFPQIQVPTLLIIGQADRTVVGKNYASPEATKNLGNYPALGKSAARAIRGAKLAEFAGVGHIPHLEAPDKFNSTLLEFLK
ncbi:Pimeloyl-ACP methyl ester carboxylesterase [Abditibacterium utsteinense]|uniref:Pimeloyl-ACP methyl ester carboxylesterase n=1 Tax=Abditibacterium utsteinense TaxID=1960156 RepID=A0A2S8SQV6_9BACT|nr:alpha/beta hydrolase [Abditibacterium utsteinense]PQV63165.1 Pimeloyl-ACP methyl ester carboxylesterase [Abditibacterium utsteinense]